MITLKTYDFFEIEKEVKKALEENFSSEPYNRGKKVKDYDIFFRVDKEEKEIEVAYIPKEALIVDEFELLKIKYRKES